VSSPSTKVGGVARGSTEEVGSRSAQCAHLFFPLESPTRGFYFIAPRSARIATMRFLIQNDPFPPTRNFWRRRRERQPPDSLCTHGLHGTSSKRIRRRARQKKGSRRLRSALSVANSETISPNGILFKIGTTADHEGTKASGHEKQGSDQRQPRVSERASERHLIVNKNRHRRV